MLAKYYHYRNTENKPIVTQCLIEFDDGVAIGYSICSPKDNPHKACPYSDQKLVKQ